MGLAIEEARQAVLLGEVPVGALVLSASGEILARAGNRVETDCDPAGHAEIIALRLACAKLCDSRLSGCILISTLEPCFMCAAAALHARIDGIVFGAADPLAGAVVSRADLFSLPMPDAKPWHMGGIRSAECADMLNDFFRTLRPGKGRHCCEVFSK